VVSFLIILRGFKMRMSVIVMVNPDIDETITLEMLETFKDVVFYDFDEIENTIKSELKISEVYVYTLDTFVDEYNNGYISDLNFMTKVYIERK
jgi:hypothetical protein